MSIDVRITQFVTTLTRKDVRRDLAVGQPHAKLNIEMCKDCGHSLQARLVVHWRGGVIQWCYRYGQSHQARHARCGILTRACRFVSSLCRRSGCSCNAECKHRKHDNFHCWTNLQHHEQIEAAVTASNRLRRDVCTVPGIYRYTSTICTANTYCVRQIRAVLYGTYSILGLPFTHSFFFHSVKNRGAIS